MNDLISRQEAIEAIVNTPSMVHYDSTLQSKYDGSAFRQNEIIDILSKLPPTIQWNVITKRPMDAEERKVASESLCYDIEYEEAYIYSNLPDDGEEVIICFSWGAVKIDTFRIEEGCYFEENGDMDGVVAWMLLPKPYAPTQSNDSKALDALDSN